jgi:UPF0042 nucleotide-binding protein
MTAEESSVVVVTGLSGAGKSTALHALEDLRYFCVDNLPTSLAKGAIEACEAGGIRRIALCIDVRVRSFLGDAGAAIQRLRESGRQVAILFLDASDQVLLRRFSETRRPHPLSTDLGVAAASVLDGIGLERQRLAPLRAQATLHVDTTFLSVHELRRQVVAFLGPASADQFRMRARVLSFGFKFGIPVDADVVLDVRFLDNPFFVPDLKELPGTDERVAGYLRGLPETAEFLARAEELVAYCLPRYEREGKSYFTLAIGCTGGRHRSVALADMLAERLGRRVDVPMTVVHRDVAARGNLVQGASHGDGGAGVGGRS